ncbi:hypothetical protein ACYX7E_07580 [Luteimonas sp. RIT-PG2_3]
MKAAVVIRHLAFKNRGTPVPLLVARGYTVRYLDAASERVCADDLAVAGLLVVLPPHEYSTR